MAGFRLLFIAALVFGIIANVYCASLKDYDPYSVKKHSTTATITTSTTATPKEMIRQCTCTESGECIQNAWSNITSCQEKCKSKLAFFGNDTDFSLKCIKNNPNDVNLINTCFKYLPGYCAKTNSSQIEKPTYKPKITKNIKIKEHEIITTFKSFYMCAGECMKEIILDCFNEKECGVVLGDSQDIGKIGEFCHSLKASVITSSAKALPCLMPGAKPRRKNSKKQ